MPNYANVMTDGRGGEYVVKNRGLSPRPSSNDLLALEFYVDFILFSHQAFILRGHIFGEYQQGAN